MGKICIVNYGMGNITSVAMALEFLDADYFVSGNPDEMAGASAFILPGVGAFKAAAERVNELNLQEPLKREVLDNKKPFLGICLGMQLLAEDSEEGGYAKGLGWFKGHVVLMKSTPELKIPHVGWNNVLPCADTPMFENIDGEMNFYFDHSYQFNCSDEGVVATSAYTGDVVAAICRDNIWATQFHPEKSQRNGLKLLRNFVNQMT